MKALLIVIIILNTTQVFSQNITNTLGNNGFFIIKDTGRVHLSMRQSNGNISINSSIFLPTSTTSNSGVIYKNDERFFHDYKPTLANGNNTFVGRKSGNFTMTSNPGFLASNNTAVGSQTLSSITTGYDNSAFGYNAMTSLTIGARNSAFGLVSLFKITSGNHNSAHGSNSLQETTTGSHNSAFGSGALQLNTIGFFNSAFGYDALAVNINGFSNSAFGVSSLENATGDRNTAVGDSSGRSLTTGNNNTMIGFNSLPSSATVSNQITLGNNQITSLRCNVQSISSLSDNRDKKNIADLNLGLDFITTLKPRIFNWDKREWYENNVSDGSKMKTELTAGFIAQELDEAQSKANAEFLDLVMKDNPEKIEATYGNLLPVMVKAIQELKEKNDLLTKELYELKMILNDTANNNLKQENEN